MASWTPQLSVLIEGNVPSDIYTHISIFPRKKFSTTQGIPSVGNLLITSISSDLRTLWSTRTFHTSHIGHVFHSTKLFNQSYDSVQ